MNDKLVLALVLMAVPVVIAKSYIIWRVLTARHPLYQQIKDITRRLALKSETLHSRWQAWDISDRQGVFTVVPKKRLIKAQEVRQEIDGKLESLLKPSIWRRVRNWVNQDRQRFLDNRAARLKVVGLIDWPFWLFWRIVYGLYTLVNWSTYSLVLSWPSHTMRRLNRRIENLQGLEKELDAAIRSVERLTQRARSLTKNRLQELKEQAEAKRLAAETAGKRRLFEELRQRLVESLNHNLRSQALAEESLVGSVLLPNLAAAKELWRKSLEEAESATPDDSQLDEFILLYRTSVLPIFEPVSVDEGTPPLSSIEHHAQKMIESEGLIRGVEEAFLETLGFSVLEVKPEEPVSLGKARSLLAEAASEWSGYKLDSMMLLARAADDMAKQAMQDVEALKLWEDVILSFDRRRANIKENEAVLLVFGVELPQTATWEEAVRIHENEVPQVWASYDWSRLNEVIARISNVFAARDQEVNRRIDAERNKRIARGEALPEGISRHAPSATPSKNQANAAPDSTNDSERTKVGKVRFDYTPDPHHMEPLVWVRSKTGVILQVWRSLVVTGGEYTTVDPNDPELLDLLRSGGT